MKACKSAELGGDMCFQSLTGYFITFWVIVAEDSPSLIEPCFVAYVTVLNSFHNLQDMAHLFPGIVSGFLSPQYLPRVPHVSGGVLSEGPDSPSL